MIFSISRNELSEYYGDFCPEGKIGFLLRCHEKIRNTTIGALHLTTSLTAISDSKQILCSAGGLGGCIYSVPIFRTHEVHGLGTYLMHNEMPMFLQQQGRTLDIQALGLFPANINVGYVDYLLFGEEYTLIYSANPTLQKAISKKEADRLYNVERSNAVQLKGVLESSYSSTRKIAAFEQAVASSATLRAIYFEIVLEYVLLFQNDALATEAAGRDELYNDHAKNLIFQLNPSLAKHFSISNFQSTPSVISSYLRRQSTSGRIIGKYDERNFYSFLLRRLPFYISHYLMNNEANLYGHVLFRCFDQRALFEQITAKNLWREAKDKGFNAFTYRMPKGEIGLLPSAESVRIFVGDIEEQRFINSSLIKVRLRQKLINNAELSLMRNPYIRTPEEIIQPDVGARVIGFVRHGESVANREGRFGGMDDSPLTATGEAQAAALGNELLRLAFRPRRIVASTRSRALRTAEIIAPILGINPESIVIDARFDEYDFGSYNGKPKQGVGSEEFMAIPDREDPQHFYARIREGWNEYVRSDGNTLLVSHAFVRHMINCALEGGDVTRFHDFAANEGSSRLSFYEPTLI